MVLVTGNVLLKVLLKLFLSSMKLYPSTIYRE